MIDTLCQTIIQQFKIDSLVETGTDKGETVAQVGRWFSEMDSDFGVIEGYRITGARSYQWNSQPIEYPFFSSVKPSRYQIHSVDLDEHSYQTARENFASNHNIHFHCGSSEKFLKSFLADDAHLLKNHLFFLDAHWGEYWPLRDELAVIRTLKKYAIVIDDFMVPGKSNASFPHGDFGFDVYKGRILNWNYVHESFKDTDVRVFYPQKSNRDGRGWVLITHGYSSAELKGLLSLGLFELDQHDAQHTMPVKVGWLAYFDLKNVLKSIVPASVLRSMYRCYEKIFFPRRKGVVGQFE